jgi:hypothetical protein
VLIGYVAIQPFYLFPAAVSIGVFSALGATEYGASVLTVPVLIGVAIVLIVFGLVNRKFSKMSGARGGLYWIGAAGIVLAPTILFFVLHGLLKPVVWNWLW